MRLNTIRIHQMAATVIERLEAQGLLQIQGKTDLVIQQLEIGRASCRERV
jgi:predicted transcriptional regulator YheO